VGVLFDGQVPYVPGVAAVVPQYHLLGGRGSSRYLDIRTHYRALLTFPGLCWSTFLYLLLGKSCARQSI
jgi:hypothetical protein